MNWRTSGDTTLKAFAFLFPPDSEIARRKEIDAVYWAASPYTRLVAGMLAAESSFATHFNAVPPSMNNPLNMRIRGKELFQSFPNIAASVNEWRARITSGSYDYKDTVTVRDLVEIYAPSFENDVDEYVSIVERVINSLPLKEGTVPTLPQPPLVQISITPHGVNRPALEMASPSWITVHEVGNTSPGADEEMHRRFVHNGGGPAAVSFHFVVGPTKVIQLLPIDEAAWHASDGYNGTGNRDSVAIETIQIGDFDKTLWHLSWLINELAVNPKRFNSNKPRNFDLSIDGIKQHYDWAPDKKNCPQFIRERGLWRLLMDRVDLWNQLAQPIELPEEKPVEENKHEIPEDMTEPLLRRLYGRAKNPVSGKLEGFDITQAPSQVWLSNGKKTNKYPMLMQIIRRGDGGMRYQWSDGFYWERDPQKED